MELDARAGPRPDGSYQRASDEFQQAYGHPFKRENYTADGLAQLRQWRTTPGAGGAHGAWLRDPADATRATVRVTSRTPIAPTASPRGGTPRW